MSDLDGGPAFPQGPEWGSSQCVPEGMSLRDYFAGQEMVTYRRSSADGPLARLWDWLWWGRPVTNEEAAAQCYMAADAMLAERDRATP